MLILTRHDLKEAVITALGGAAAIGLGFYFRNEIESYLGHTLTSWLLPVIFPLYLFSIASTLIGWLSIRDWERREREQKAADDEERAKWVREEQQAQAEYDAFTNWVKHNPVTAARLMSIVEDEQIEDPEYHTWIREWRRTGGPNPLTDLPRLFEWLKARGELKNTGIDPPLPPTLI
jgi:hypothetical protein